MITKTDVSTTNEPLGATPAPPANSKYLTEPVVTSKMPPGVPYIIGNEAAERFSFYGMRTILVIFMTHYLMGADGKPDLMTDPQAREWFHLFVAAVYFFPLIGSIVADVYFGKYLIIMSLSLVYCLGHLALSLDDTRIGLAIGLTVSAIASGGSKPSVSANVGDQFGAQNRHLLTRVYMWFYFAINVGSAISMLWIPVVLRKQGAHWAFGIPGILMFIATVVFWMGRKKFVHAPPESRNRFLKLVERDGGLRTSLNLLPVVIVLGLLFYGFVRMAQGNAVYILLAPAFAAVLYAANLQFSWLLRPLKEYGLEIIGEDGWKALKSLLPIYVVVAVFWSLYDQCSSSWVQQAEHMDLHFAGQVWTADQFQVFNPLLVLINVPLFSYIIYPVLGKFFRLTPLRKMSIGFFFTFASFLVPAWVETQISAGLKPTIAWQILAYIFLMISEIMVYATGLEFSYTQAPKKMKSMVMAIFLATNTAGNLFTSAVNFFIQNPDGSTKLTGANYYLFFAALMFVASIGFIFIAVNYRGKTFIEGEAAATA